MRATGQKAATSYGPIPGSKIPTPSSPSRKWLHVFIVPVQMVTFVQGSKTLFVAPCAVNGSVKSITLIAGSVWLNVASFASGSPADCMPESPYKAEQSPVTVAAPGDTDGDRACGRITHTHCQSRLPDKRRAPAGLASHRARVDDIHLSSRQIRDRGDRGLSPRRSMARASNANKSSQPAAYNGTLNALVFPFSASQTQFAPNSTGSAMGSLQGGASLEIAGWADRWRSQCPRSSVTQRPPGSSIQVSLPAFRLSGRDSARPEPEGGGIALASGDTFVLWTAAGLALGAQQRSSNSSFGTRSRFP